MAIRCVWATSSFWGNYQGFAVSDSYVSSPYLWYRGSQPGLHLPVRRGTFEVSNRSEIYIYISFISKHLYIYQWILFSKAVICLLNIYD